MTPLNPVEIRVLGCLAEKELATPEYYPLTLNALVNACNQKSNRSPVVQYDDLTVAGALESLRPVGLVTLSAEGGRTAKYCHNLDGKLKLSPPELAVLVELLLRGPQTPGELRQRASRMSAIDSLEELEEILEEMQQREEPIVVRLPRQPGRKECRYAQLLAGEPELEAVDAELPAAVRQVRADNQRLDELEQQVTQLSEELAELREEFRQFRQQFD